MNYKGLTRIVTLLHVAALRGNIGIFQYLINNFGFKQLLCEPILKNILHFCVIDTLNREHQVVEREQMIECILNIQPSLINERYLQATPLLVPNINIGLLMHLVNLRADVFAADASSQNIMQLSPHYMTPEEYHQLVNYLHTRGHSKLLSAKSDNMSTPLHTAVRYLEIRDTTVEMFSSANIDFNALDVESKTVLMQALVSGRSARLLNTLIVAGPADDVKKYHKLSTALHLAAEHGNLSYVRYFISRGSNVNSTNPYNFTPLHFALIGQQKPLIQEIVQVLVEHGANVNAIARNEITPLSLALKKHQNKEIKDQTVNFLKERGAEEFSALKNVKSRLQKLQIEIIDRNLNKIIEKTHCSMILLDKLLDTGTLTKFEVEEMNMEVDDRTQVSMLYRILRGRPDLQEFMTALEETNQTEALNIVMTETLNSKEVKSLLQFAVVNLEYDAVEHFVKAQGLSNLLFDPFFASIIHDCIDTFIYSITIHDDKLRVLDLILGINPGLVHSRNEESHTPLHLAILNPGDKQLELICLLIKHKGNVNAKDSREYSPLHLAVMHKSPPPNVNVMEIIKILIANGADTDAVDSVGCTFLHCAPEFLTQELYNDLIEYFDSTDRIKSLQIVDNHNFTHLHHAVQHLETLKSTLEIFKKQGLDFNGVDKNGYSVLFHAIESGRSASFLNTLNSFGTDWTITNKKHENPLHWAVRYSHLDALKFFLSLGCDVNASNLYGRTPLHAAVLAKNINVEVINELIKHGADVNAQNNNENCKDPDNRTPLHQALTNHSDKQVELIRLLIDHKADVNARDYRDCTPLHYAVIKKTSPPNVIEIIKLLIESGADPDAVDSVGCTFLHIAPQFRTAELYAQIIEYFDSTNRENSWKMADNLNWTHLHCAVLFLEPLKSTLEIFNKHGLDFNGVTTNGDSVLFIAILGGRSATFLNTLISFGADWTILNKNQDNPLHLAAYYSNLEALKMFISFGFDVNTKNIDGHTPLHNAFLGKRYGVEIVTDHEVVDELLEQGADVDARDNQGKLPIDLANERATIGKVEDITIKLLEAFST